MSEQRIFHLYRYQINPNQRIQEKLPLEEGQHTVDEVIARKNEYFMEAFNYLAHQATLGEIDGTQDKYRLKKIYPKDEFNKQNSFFIFWLAKPKSIKIDTEDFTTQRDVTWPRSYVLIWNDPEKQLIAVEHRTQVAASTTTLINELEKRLNEILRQHNLNTHINPIFNQESFWSLVEDKKVEKIEFHLVTPNMANISHSLSEDLKKLAKRTNASTSNLGLSAESFQELNISKDNPQLKDMVDYSSKGGGYIKMKVKGLRRTIDTKNNVTSVALDDLTIIGNDIEAVQETLDKFL
ncbi:hypothetical protein HMPREF3144_06585 [Oligella sp. HMSC05A10]|uniref:hypothetical protein n=1 Tax=Oligella sp. HMSC05A10 TaxID=1581112 RepID=UPI0008A51EEC|nr:hypothetical protein [Oligella sp. HMSC05A10]OFS84507.1 hypothetical protein HMPREF3144_06585 [Oligella sp. HMSC05A10]